MIPWIPHTYIILYRAIYLIPVYICITGATYIHTKNEAGDDRPQHHGSGKTSVIHVHSHGPHLGCGLPSPPAMPPAPGASLLGEGQGEERVHATITGEGWAVTAGGTGFSAPGVPRISSSLTIDPCLRRNEGGFHSLCLTPTPDSSCGPRFLPGGAPLLCQPRGTFWNVSRTRGGGVCPQGVGWREGGARRQVRREGWGRAWWLGAGAGGRLRSQAAGRVGNQGGLGQTGATVRLGLGRRGRGPCWVRSWSGPWCPGSSPSPPHSLTPTLPLPSSSSYRS